MQVEFKAGREKRIKVLHVGGGWSRTIEKMKTLPTGTLVVNSASQNDEVHATKLLYLYTRTRVHVE